LLNFFRLQIAAVTSVVSLSEFVNE